MMTSPNTTDEALEEAARIHKCSSPQTLWAHIKRFGNEDSLWKHATPTEKNLLKQFIGKEINEAKKDNVEYAYYFYSRVLKRLVQGLPPIGKEWND